ncbi:MAG: penicillin-binding protein, partial [Polaribacter sp.]|nr:penicillin-binding protein [Polaribacter sp.]
MTIFFIAIVIQLIDIQYFQAKKYKELATELTIRQDTVFANKGNVYAADGNLLATSMSKFTIRMDVVAVDDKDFSENVVALA